MKNKLFKEYCDWFKNKWDCLPYEKNTYFPGVTNVEELISFRNDPAIKNDLKLQKQLEIITFEEYKKLWK